MMRLHRLPAELRFQIWEATLADDKPGIYFFNRLVDADLRAGEGERRQWYSSRWHDSSPSDVSDGDAEDSTNTDNDNDGGSSGGDNDDGAGRKSGRRSKSGKGPQPSTRVRMVLMPYPVAMHVCAESRAAVRRRLSFRAVQYPAGGRSLLDVPCRPFRPDLDVVFVPDWEVDELPHSLSYGTRFDPDFYGRVRVLAVPPRCIAEDWEEDIADALPSLTTIAVAARQRLGCRDLGRCFCLRLDDPPRWPADSHVTHTNRHPVAPDVVIVNCTMSRSSRSEYPVEPRDEPAVDYYPFIWRMRSARQ